MGRKVQRLLVLQSPARRQLFKTANPAIPLPPEPIITRWGTWLNACVYYADNFDAVKSVVDGLNENDAESIRKSKKIFVSANIQKQLAFIKANFSCVVRGIKVLESKGLELNVSLEVIENVRSNLSKNKKKEFLEKFERVLARNVGYQPLVKIKDILYGYSQNDEIEDEYVASLSPSEIAMFKFAVVTSVDVERTFSTYKSVLTEKRRSFTFEHFKQHLLFACNVDFL